MQLFREGFPATWCVAALVFLGGCSKSSDIVPVSGKVLYQKEPLGFGTVTFQPRVGPQSRGSIQEDGTFVLSTHGDGDGATIGENQVRITCFEIQKTGYSATQGNQEMSLGPSLIPRRYTKYGTSGLKVQVQPETTEPIVFELTDE